MIVSTSRIFSTANLPVLLLFGVLFYLLFVVHVLLVDIVPISSELPVGGDQEEPIFEEDFTQLVEEGKWLSPSALSF
jgi:hypothetical protein